MNQPAVELVGLSKSFGSVRAVQDVHLTICQGEMMVLVGPSGCGKTTLLRLLAGFETPDAGEIIVNGRVVAGARDWVPPEQREIGMVFQDYALFPHLTVFDNVAFGLQKHPRARRSDAVRQWLERVGLGGYEKRYPHELSGGERQRVALARALAPQPGLILMDEPFSNLDADRRAQVREEVHGILRGLGTTIVFVTHDQEEALLLGDQVAVIQQGRLAQVGSPDRVFGQPATRFVAEFLGQTDFLPGVVTPGGIETEAGRIVQPVAQEHGKPVDVAVRADDVEMIFDDGASGCPAVIVSREYKGTYTVYRLQLPSGRLIHSIQPHTYFHAPGTLVTARIAPGHPLAWYRKE